MKVILAENIHRLGRVGDIVEVADGYARNYLIPQGKALPPTEDNIRRMEKEKERLLAKLAQEKADFQALAEKIQELSLTIAMKASEEGHLYGSVNAQIIAQHLEEEGIKVKEQWIALEEPIKEVGRYTITFKFPHDITFEVNVWVVAEED